MTCVTTGKKWVHVMATEIIRSGEEILIDYGDEYCWEDKLERQMRGDVVGQVQL